MNLKLSEILVLVENRLASADDSLRLSTLTALSGSELPTDIAANNIAVRATNTVNLNQGRNAREARYRSTLVVELLTQISEDKITSRNDALDLAEKIRDHLDQLDEWVPADGVDQFYYVSSQYGYHPRSPGWYLIQHTFYVNHTRV